MIRRLRRAPAEGTDRRPGVSDASEDVAEPLLTPTIGPVSTTT